MHTYKVLNEFGEVETIKLHDEQILSNELKEDGKWPAAFDPWSNPSYQPHYSVSVFDHTDGEIASNYTAQFFVEDMESDAFIVEVHGEETHLHLHHQSILDADMLYAIAHTVQEIETALPQIEKQHDKTLGLGE